VGKSSLLAAISAARPKVDNYHFTTLQPCLGVVRVDDERSFVCADIPGLIEGAAEGAGLGHAFLRHIERCRLLVHVVDVSASERPDPCADFDVILRELRKHHPELAEREALVAANKTDVNTEHLDALRAHVAPLEVYPVSAAAGHGTRELVYAIARRLERLPPPAVYEPEPLPPPPALSAADTSITLDGEVWRLEGEWLRRLLDNVNLDDRESLMYFDRTLRKYGVYESMKRAGVREGHTVSFCGAELEFGG
jgi:GTP-binding protein